MTICEAWMSSDGRSVVTRATGTCSAPEDQDRVLYIQKKTLLAIVYLYECMQTCV